MSDQIREFPERMKDWKKNFSIEECDCTKYDCEVADIIRMQNEGNVDGLIDFWNKKSKEDYFELKYPVYNEIKLRAVGNYFSGTIENYVVFMDQNKNLSCS